MLFLQMLAPRNAETRRAWAGFCSIHGRGKGEGLGGSGENDPQTDPASGSSGGRERASPRPLSPSPPITAGGLFGRYTFQGFLGFGYEWQVDVYFQPSTPTGAIQAI